MNLAQRIVLDEGIRKVIRRAKAAGFEAGADRKSQTYRADIPKNHPLHSRAERVKASQKRRLGIRDTMADTTVPKDPAVSKEFRDSERMRKQRGVSLKGPDAAERRDVERSKAQQQQRQSRADARKAPARHAAALGAHLRKMGPEKARQMGAGKLAHLRRTGRVFAASDYNRTLHALSAEVVIAGKLQA